MADSKKTFLVRCSTSEFDALRDRAASLGFGSAVAGSSRPGVARYLVERGLGDIVMLTSDDRVLLRRLLLAIRDAHTEVGRLTDASTLGEDVLADAIVAALGALGAAARAIAALRPEETV